MEKSRENVISNVANFKEINNNRMVLTTVQTDNGYELEYKEESKFPAEFDDFKLENLLKLGVKLNYMQLPNDRIGLNIKHEIEEYAKNVIDNLTNKEN